MDNLIYNKYEIDIDFEILMGRREQKKCKCCNDQPCTKYYTIKKLLITEITKNASPFYLRILKYYA